MIDGVRVRLSAGMSLSAEIKTGKRRVIDYLLSPLRTQAEQSLRER
jgi:hemolysin D